MCLVITGMQPYNEIDINAPFSVAFDAVGLGWARTVVALGALAGILTSLLGSLMGQARIYVTLGRQHLLTPWLVSARGRGGVRKGWCVWKVAAQGDPAPSHTQACQSTPGSFAIVTLAKTTLC